MGCNSFCCSLAVEQKRKLIYKIFVPFLAQAIKKKCDTFYQFYVSPAQVWLAQFPWTTCKNYANIAVNIELIFWCPKFKDYTDNWKQSTSIYILVLCSYDTRLNKKYFDNIIVRTQFVTTPKSCWVRMLKGPNNKICRVWAWKVRPWSPNGG